MKLETIKRQCRTPRKGSIVFVHGGFHDAWCWVNYLEYFANAGFDCYAISLRGHGKSEGHEYLNKWGLSDYLIDVMQVIETVTEKHIFVGHSM